MHILFCLYEYKYKSFYVNVSCSGHKIAPSKYTTTVLFPQELLYVYGMDSVKMRGWHGVCPWGEGKRRGIVGIAVGEEKGQPVCGMCLC